MKRGTVTVYNFIGEVNGKATYNRTVVSNVFSEVSGGSVSSNTDGDKIANTCDYMFFDKRLNGENAKKFKPAKEWNVLTQANKMLYWTLRLGDYIIMGTHNEELSPRTIDSLSEQFEVYKITECIRKGSGSPTMWHWKVAGNA